MLEITEDANGVQSSMNPGIGKERSLAIFGDVTDGKARHDRLEPAQVW